MRPRSIFSIISVLLLLISSSLAASASSLVDDVWVPPNFPKQGYVNVTFADNSGVLMGAGAPHLEWRNGKSGSESLQILCTGLDDPRCSKTTGKFIYFTRLVACSDTNRVDCIESLSAIRNGVEVQGVEREVFPKVVRTKYLADASKSLPLASSGALWNFPSIGHPGGEDFFVNAVLSGSKESNASQFKTDGISITVSAVDLRKTTKDDGSSYVLENSRPADGTFLGAVGIYPPYEDEQYLCVMSGDGLCANRRALPAGLGFKMTLRLSSSPSGWLHGRIGDGNLAISPLEGQSGIRLSVEGSSVRVASLGFAYPWKEIPTEIQTKYNSGEFTNQSKLPTIGCRWCSEDPLINTLVSNPLAYGQDAFQELSAWTALRKDTADADLNTWSVRSLSEFEMEDAIGCFAKKGQVSGFVSTNATVYSAGPPKLIKGSLDYQVAAPHFQSDGAELLGRYRLIVRSEVARCVYGFSAAPVSARVTVTSADGGSQIATTSVTERNGWISLSADNFTFSSPVIKVKLEQKVEPTTTPTPVASPLPVVVSPSSTPEASKPKTKNAIVCVKGSSTKRVSGKSPKCPKGFKLRA
ncbi:MAG: hypothetical protein ACKOFA_01155 [Rhodoluna sp.]